MKTRATGLDRDREMLLKVRTKRKRLAMIIAKNPLPKEGEIFQLVLKRKDTGDNAFPDKMCGYFDTKKRALTAREGMFKLVRVKTCETQEGLREKLEKHGRIPEGQWLLAFKRKYAVHDGGDKMVGRIAIADFSFKSKSFEGAMGFPILVNAYSHQDLQDKWSVNWQSIGWGLNHLFWMVEVDSHSTGQE